MKDCSFSSAVSELPQEHRPPLLLLLPSSLYFCLAGRSIRPSAPACSSCTPQSHPSSLQELKKGLIRLLCVWTWLSLQLNLYLYPVLYWGEIIKPPPKQVVKGDQWLSIRADPFGIILELQLAWVLDFCLWPKKWEIQNFFGFPTSNIYLEIQHLPTAPRAFFESLPQNTLISIEIKPLVLDMQCCYSH